AALEIDEHFVTLARCNEDRLDLIRLGKESTVPANHGELVIFESQAEVARVRCVREAPPLPGAVLHLDPAARAAVGQHDITLPADHEIFVDERRDLSARVELHVIENEGTIGRSRNFGPATHEQHPVEPTLDLDMRTNVRVKPKGARIHHRKLVVERFTY